MGTNDNKIETLNNEARQIATIPDPFEPFHISQGFRIGDFIILSGQAALNEQGEIVGVNDFDAQAHQVFHNLKTLLALEGSSLDHVVKVTIFLTDMSYFSRIVELRKQYFSPPYPADTIVEVQALALPELMIEIEAIALG